MKNKVVHGIAYFFLVVGGLNWLLFALFERELGALFGGMDALASKIIYILVGLSAIYLIATHKKDCKCCGSCASESETQTEDSSANTGEGSEEQM